MGFFGKPSTARANLQRRAYVRVAGTSRVDLRIGGFSTATQILDISEGGMRCSVAHTFPVSPGTRVRAIFTVDDTELEIAAEVVRQTVDSLFLQDIGLRFVHSDRSKREALRRHILDRQFEQQRARRA